MLDSLTTVIVQLGTYSWVNQSLSAASFYAVQMNNMPTLSETCHGNKNDQTCPITHRYHGNILLMMLKNDFKSWPHQSL